MKISTQTVYTISMPKYAYVQVNGVDKAAKIEADEIKEESQIGYQGYQLSLSLNGKLVGKFKGTIVDGWWIQDEGSV